jgi:thioredoxin 1
MLRMLIGTIIGGIAGGAIGYFSRCSGGGGCPLMGNPIGGVLFGGLFGLFVSASFYPRTEGPAFGHSQKVIEVTTVEQFRQLLAAPGVVLADFYADWCGPCRKLKPVIHGLADEYSGRAVVATVNVDKVGALAREYGVSSIPDVRVFRNGQAFRQSVGARTKASYSEALDQALVP